MLLIPDISLDVEGTAVKVIVGIYVIVLVILLYIVNMTPGQNGQLAANQYVD